MNYYAARQRENDKKWDYTCMNDGRTWPTGYCSRFLEAKVGEYGYTIETVTRHNSFKDKYGPHYHETKKEAEDCYKEYLLDNSLHFWPYQAPTEEKPMERREYRCQAPGCESYKTGLADINHRHFHLCDEHQTREVITAIFDVGESWSSY